MQLEGRYRGAPYLELRIAGARRHLRRASLLPGHDLLPVQESVQSV